MTSLKDPREYIEALKASFDRGTLNNLLLSELEQSLSNATGEWFSEFMNMGGPGALIPLISVLADSDTKTDEQWRVHYLGLSCLRRMMTTEQEVDCMLDVVGFTAAVLRSFQPKSLLIENAISVNEIALKMLIVLTRITVRSAQSVFDSLDEDCEECGSTSIFSGFLDGLFIVTNNPGIRHSILLLINTMVNVPDNIFVRSDLRMELKEEGFDKDLAVLGREMKDDLQIVEQISIYIESAISDELVLTRLQYKAIANNPGGPRSIVPRYRVDHVLKKLKHCISKCSDSLASNVTVEKEEIGFLIKCGKVSVDLLNILQELVGEIEEEEYMGDDTAVLTTGIETADGAASISPVITNSKNSPLENTNLMFLDSPSSRNLLSAKQENSSETNHNGISDDVASIVPNESSTLSPPPPPVPPPPPPPPRTPPSLNKCAGSSMQYPTLGTTRRMVALKLAPVETVAQTVWGTVALKENVKINMEQCLEMFGRSRGILKSSSDVGHYEKKEKIQSFLPPSIVRSVDIFLGRFGGPSFALNFVKNQKTMIPGKSTESMNIFIDSILRICAKLPELTTVLLDIENLINSTDRSHVYGADCFIYDLSKIPFVSRRLECFIKTENFASSVAFLEQRLKAVSAVCDEILNSKRLGHVLDIFLQFMNFSNSTMHENYVYETSFKLFVMEHGQWTCLLFRLSAIKATTDKISFLDYILRTLYSEKPDLVKLLNDFPLLKDTIIDASYFEQTEKILKAMQDDITFIQESLDINNVNYVKPLDKRLYEDMTGEDPFNELITTRFLPCLQKYEDAEAMFTRTCLSFKNLVTYLTGEINVNMLWEELLVPLKTFLFQDWMKSLKSAELHAVSRKRRGVSSNRVPSRISGLSSQNNENKPRRRSSLVQVVSESSPIEQSIPSVRHLVTANVSRSPADPFQNIVDGDAKEGANVYANLRRRFLKPKLPSKKTPLNVDVNWKKDARWRKSRVNTDLNSPGLQSLMSLEQQHVTPGSSTFVAPSLSLSSSEQAMKLLRRTFSDLKSS